MLFPNKYCYFMPFMVSCSGASVPFMGKILEEFQLPCLKTLIIFSTSHFKEKISRSSIIIKI